MPSIRKSLADITSDDLGELCRDKVTEDEQIDFKETVPNRSDKAGDPWREKRAITDYGRDQLLAAVVGFANSYGGDLVVGIREDGGKPGGAESIVPLDECEDLAHRLLHQANACIEPPIPTLNARGIVTDGNKAGVVIVRTSRSRLSPHRLKTTLECYQRVRHETLPMSMRQIQDLTLNVTRGLDKVDKRFEALRSAFHGRTQVSNNSLPVSRFGMRVSCVPLDESCALDHVHDVAAIRPENHQVHLNLRDDFRAKFVFPTYFSMWYPILRGSETTSDESEKRARMSVHCDGTINYEFIRDVMPPSQQNSSYRVPFVLYPGWLFAMIVNAIEAADRFRKFAGASATEYGLEVEIVNNAKLAVIVTDGHGFEDTKGHFPGGIHLFPRYSVAGKDAWSAVLTLVWRDFWNSIGVNAATDSLSIPDA